ncbi:MAG: flagellar hook-basal body complex protein FliE [Pseudomonadota bacterium]
MDVNTLSAVQKYGASKPATEPSQQPGNSLFGSLVNDFASTLAASEAEAKQAMVGDADPHALVQALAQTELAVETAVTVRNKVVEAYQEVLRMPV